MAGHLRHLAEDADLPADLVSRLTPADLRECEDLEDDTLATFLHARLRSEEMAKGQRPASYTQASVCGGCGPVWLWEGAPREAVACPWCWHRDKGVSFPRPLMACDDCRHYLPNPANPVAGMGRCAEGHSASQSKPLYPKIERQCQAWRAKR